MKKTWIKLSLAVMIAALTACGGTQNETEGEALTNNGQQEKIDAEADKELADTIPSYNPTVGLELPAFPEDNIKREIIEISDSTSLQDFFSRGRDISNTEVRLKDGEYKIEYSLYIGENENVSLIGNGKTSIILDNGEDVVINAYNTKNLLIYGLTLGHEIEPTDECSEGVLSFSQCEDVTVIGCDIFGCGLVGINTYNDVTVKDSVIRDCSYAAITTEDSCVVHLMNTIIQGNKGPYLFSGWKKTEFIFDDCVIQDNLSQKEFQSFAEKEEFSVEKNNTIEENNAWEK